ncbi:MAG: hypothetical protein HYZ20_06500 [Burkholderiales bacterium]|nr:hypothetical protein [Burkholderiales bacterium]
MPITSPQTGGLAAALRAAGPGGTIVLAPGSYAGDVGIVTQPGLTITSPGPGAVLRADGRHAEGKAILVVRAPDVRIENLEFRAARVPAGNGAGIRFESGSLVLDRCRFVDNEMGVLTAGRPDMALAVYHCHFGDAPRHDSGMLHHLLYVGAIGHCVVMHSRFGGGWRGHLLKSRARISRILFNEFDDGEAGGASYELEFPNGGDAMVLGNRIAQSPASDNPAMLSMGAEGGGAGPHRLLLRGNHFVDRRARSAEAPSRFVHLWPERLAGPLEVLAEGNRFDGAGQIGLPG